MAYEPKPGEKLPLEDFKTIVTQTPLVSIDLIVRQADGRVWLGRRSNQPAKGTFFVPGGRITKNETRSAAFERITLAELGVQIKLSEATFLGSYDHIYKENWFEDVAFGTHYVVLAYELRWRQNADPVSIKQHTESCWKTENEILDSGEVHENTRAYFLGGAIRSESQYSVLAARRNSFNTMMWQTPALSLTAQAFLLTIAANQNAFPEVRMFTCLLALCVALSTLQLFAKHRRNEENDARLLEEFEREHRHLGYATISARPSGNVTVIGKMTIGRILTGGLAWLQKRRSFYLWSALLFLFASVAVVLLVLNVWRWNSTKSHSAEASTNTAAQAIVSRPVQITNAPTNTIGSQPAKILGTNVVK